MTGHGSPRFTPLRRRTAAAAALVLVLGLAACGGDDDSSDGKSAFDCSSVTPDMLAAPGTEVPEFEGTLTVYSGRSQQLVGPLLECFGKVADVKMDIRYTSSSEEAAQLIATEGSKSPADVFFSQSPGSTGFLEKQGRLVALPADVLDRVPAALVSAADDWVGTSGRVRTLVYNTKELTESDLPASVFDLTDPAWKGRVGVAPSNASFQDFVAAIIALRGEDEARAFLDGLAANNARTYDNNTSIVDAVARGEVQVGLVNHYYALQTLANSPSTPIANHSFDNGDLGNLILAASVSILDTAGDQQTLAEAFVRFLLSDPAQRYFVETVKEYPSVEETELADGQKPLSELGAPEEDLNLLGGLLDEAVTMIEDSGLADG
jgi:iron(III) transport system substrate-binding protein